MLNLNMFTRTRFEALNDCRVSDCVRWRNGFFIVAAFFATLAAGSAKADDGQSGAGSSRGTGSPVEGGMDWGTLDSIEVYGFRVAPEVLSWNDFNNLLLRNDQFFEGNIGDFSPNSGLDANSSKPTCANPIIPSTGAKSEQEVDFSSQALEMPLYLSRTYNSNMTSNYRGFPLFGSSWSSSFDYWMFGETDENAISYLFLSRPDGRFIKFKHVGGDRYNEDKPGSIAYVQMSYPDNYTWEAMHYTEDSKIEHYRLGNIISIRNEHGVGWNFSWAPFQYGVSGFTRQRLQRVTHTSGQYVEFLYNGSNPHVVSSVRDPGGNIYQYSSELSESNGQSYSRTVTYPGGTTITHHYKWLVGELLLGKSINGVRYSTFSYNSASAGGHNRNSAYSSEHAGGVNRSTFDYIYGSDVTKIASVTETNPLGKKTTITFNDKGNVVSVASQASVHCASSYSSTTYDTNGYRDVATDFSGAITDFDYDAGGHLLRKVEAVGSTLSRTTNYLWDLSKNRLIGETIAGERRIEYIYDAGNRLAEVKTINLSGNGVPNQTRSTRFAYTKHQNGLLSTVVIDGPVPGSGDSTSYSYDTLGNLLTTSNGLGQLTRYENYNGLGQPGKVTDPNGVVVEYQYDARGRVIVERAFLGSNPVEVHYVYGASGLLDAKTASDGNAAYYHYDAARRLIQEDLTEPGGGHSVKRYTYDAMSNPIKIEIGRDN